jgi:putative nucleotidyltransferase with HDIG domain
MWQPDVRHWAFAALSVAAAATAYWVASDSPPVAAAAILLATTAPGMQARLAKGRGWAALQITASAAALAALGAPPRLLGTLLIVALAGAELISRCSGRSAVLRAGAWTGVIAGVVSLSGVVATAPPAWAEAVREALGAAGGGLLSAPVVVTFGPIAEWLFGHTTRLTMSEWLSYEHPLLRDLAAKAPGTFQHSINVGVLADAAAGALGADALLVRVAGMYHDVGKVRAPEYFIENQEGENPHDLLDPRESARILRAHVTDGVKLVMSHGMGNRIADFVREHHGTSVMRLFLEKARTRGAPDTREDAFRYQGPRPRSREAALVMICDQLEATARSAPPADEAGCQKVVRRTIERIRTEQQLEDSGMSSADLTAIEFPLSRALHAMYHRRLSYPAADARPPLRARLAMVARALPRRRARL